MSVASNSDSYCSFSHGPGEELGASTNELYVATTSSEGSVEPTVVPAREMKALVEKLKASAAPALVVGHSNTVGETIAALGITDPVKIGDADYDNLFIVVPGTKPALLRLHY